MRILRLCWFRQLLARNKANNSGMCKHTNNLFVTRMCCLLIATACQCSQEAHKGKLTVYKTASDIINYVNEGCSDDDSTATAVVLPPLIRLPSPSDHPFLSPIASSLSSSLSPRSKPSTVTMDPSKPLPQSKRRREADFACACDCVCERRGQGGEEGVVPYSTENGHLSSEWCCIKEEADKRAGCGARGADLKHSWKGRAQWALKNIQLSSFLNFSMHLSIIFFQFCSHPLIIVSSSFVIQPPLVYSSAFNCSFLLLPFSLSLLFFYGASSGPSIVHPVNPPPSAKKIQNVCHKVLWTHCSPFQNNLT